MMSLQIRDTPLALEKALQQDGTGNKRSLTSDKHKRYRHVCAWPRFLAVKPEWFPPSAADSRSSLSEFISNCL